MVVYAEGVVMLNFVVDLLLLLAANRLCGYQSPLYRCIAAAAVGGLYAGICLIPGFEFMGHIIWCVVVLAIMSWIAYGWNVSTFRRGCIFVLLSMALGGIAMGSQYGGLFVVPVAVVGLFLMCRVGFAKKIIGTQYVPVMIKHGDKCLHMTALTDTGNTLRDPITGKPVLVIGPKEAQKLVGLNSYQLRDPVGTMESVAIPGLRLIPYHSVGNSAGLMLGMKFKEVTIGGLTGAAMVAFASDVLDRSGTYQALTGGSI